MTDAPQSEALEATPSRSKARQYSALLAGFAITAIAFLLLGWFLGVRDAPPASISAEAGFARDMQVHHDQAVLMSLIVRERTDDPEIDGLGFDIATSQAQQSGQMHAWLELWGVPQASPEPAMTWMSRPAFDGSSHAHGDGTPAGDVPEVMPGYASAEDLARLQAASGVEAERIFLELMIAHHQGGVEMAEAVIERSRESHVLTLARSIVAAQQAEIALMTDLLEARQD